MTYSLEETKALLDAQVAKKGADYVYPHAGSVCYYFEQSQPSCIVGHVFSDIGLTEDEVHEADYLSQPERVRSLFDGRASELLYYAQNAQDSGVPWGEAVENSYKAVNNRVDLYGYSLDA